jgi:hypothetical protein
VSFFDEVNTTKEEKREEEKEQGDENPNET